ncbi:MAG: SDR family oxidoreductase [Proteobacteria bacterium]|nr:SDR family oxidoreductase [Pseudomonadota bacterium]
MSDLRDKVVVVTGGGRGIGRATALRFAEAGSRVVVAARTPGQIEAVAEEVRSAGGACLAVATDVRDEAAVRELASRTLDEFGAADVLVNNAGGGGGRSALVDMEVEQWDETFALNCRGSFLCCKHFLPAMIERHQGSIVNVGSASARHGRAMLSAYSAAKYAVIGLTQALANEVGRHGIRVNAVMPGTIRTEALQGYFERLAVERGETVEQVETLYAERSPMQRILETGEIADSILFVASEAARGMHGHCMDVNAGAWLH